MYFLYYPGALRYRCRLAWVIYLMVVACCWLGSLGVGWVIVLATPMLRRAQQQGGYLQRFSVTATALHDCWIWQSAVCVQLSELAEPAAGAQSGSRYLWLFADEVSAARWSELRRWLKLNLPTQAVGLSISK